MSTILLHDATFHTLHPSQPQVQALVIKSGIIRQAGSVATLKSRFPEAKPFSLQGSHAVPGLTDAHLHFRQFTLNIQKVNCETPTRKACLQRVAERACQTPQGEWILGHGWDQNAWSEGFGDPGDLDRIAPHHPVYLTAKSLHAAWANSLALQKAGITKTTPDPPGGVFTRDAQGHPTGFMFEDALQIFSNLIPEPDPAELARAMEEAQEALWALGLTGIHDFDRDKSFGALQILHQQGDLKLRVLKQINVQRLSEAVQLGLRSGFGDDMLRIGGIKIFADGALGPQTGAMLEPYQGTPGETGILLVEEAELTDLMRTAVENGLSLAVHAIGDRANRTVLNAYTKTKERCQAFRNLRHRIEHVQLLHPEDAPRLAELDLIASMQPIHAPSDMDTAEHYWGERAALAYAWKTQLNHGAHLAFGSDAPVESPNPFWGIHAAVTRQRRDGTPGPQGWYPEQRLSVGEAIQAYTSGPAYAAGWEDRLGKLLPGYYADLIVLPKNPFHCPPPELHTVQPLATMVNGEWVWGAFSD